jgi:hypothetical protein
MTDAEAENLWPTGCCTICGHSFSDEELDKSENCPECESRPRTRTLPILVHYLGPLTSRLSKGELLAFAKTIVEGKYIDPVFGKSRSVSLYGTYSGNHESGVDIRDLSRYSENQFCGSFSSLLFDYFPEHDKALAELSRVIHPSGLFMTHIANFRLTNGDDEPYIAKQIEGRADYFDYLGKETIPSIIVGRNWFFNAIDRNGFNPGIISIRDPPTGEYFLWYIGIRRGDSEDFSLIETASAENDDVITKLEWEPVAGAKSYRMIIRDDELGEITNKDILGVTQYDFSWNNRKKINNRFRYRTQFRTTDEGEWIDMEGYRYLEPPHTIAVSDSGIRKYSITMLKHLHENVFNE